MKKDNISAPPACSSISEQTSEETGHVKLQREQNQYLPADTVESDQAKQVGEADLRAFQRKGCRKKTNNNRTYDIIASQMCNYVVRR